MNRRRHRRRRWLKRLVKGLVALSILLLLAFGVVQVLLGTSWARQRASSELSQRLGGLPVEIGGLGWTPWSGARIGELKVLQPEALRTALAAPLLTVDRIDLDPDYRSLFKGRLAADHLHLEKPQLHVSFEMLYSIAASSLPPAEPPVVAARSEDRDIEMPPPVAGPEGGGEIEETPTTAEVAVAPPAEPASTPKKPKRKRVRVTIEGGALELVRVGAARRLAAVEGMDFDLPVFGEPAETENRVGLIEVKGFALEEELPIRLESGETMLKFLLPDTGSTGLSGYLALGPRKGVPFQADVRLQIDEIKGFEVHPMATLGCGELEARFQAMGWLQSPGSWNGVAGFRTEQVDCRLGGASLGFESATGSLSLSRGVLRVPDIRLAGERGAVLGNGWVTASDASSVFRLVVPYPAVSLMNEQLAKRVDDGVFTFKSLDPGNRWYSDVSVWRSEDKWMAGFGEGGSVVSISDLLNRE
ncbi:MAG: hypothetical protein AAGI48_13540 [Verrucomicrobiota bacterium]